jgi:hypothetical protein
MIIDNLVESMKCISLSSKWNSKYLHATVPHSAVSTGFKYLLGHNASIIINIS